MARMYRFVESFKTNHSHSLLPKKMYKFVIAKLPLTSLRSALRLDKNLVGKFSDKLMSALAKNPSRHS